MLAMIPYPELYVLRHGETQWNAQGRLQGGLNSPLTAVGRRQAERQAQIMAEIDLSRFTCLSSPQGRALETAAIVLSQKVPQIHTDAGLREIGVGEWAGRLRAEVVTGSEDAFALYARAPRGEGFAALEARCAAFLAGLHGPVVLVTHGITSRMIRALATGAGGGAGAGAIADIGGGQGVVYHVKNGVQKRLD